MDNVNHPSHYNTGKYEVIRVIDDWCLPFTLGNAIKYIARAGIKDPSKTIEDLKKAMFYLNYEIQRLETDRIEVQAFCMRRMDAVKLRELGEDAQGY